MAEAKASRKKQRPRATMADVARLAGVSQTTVSFVINDRPSSGISPETRDRVLAAVQELDYRPNRAAANLRLRRTYALGFHVSRSMLERNELFALSFITPLIKAADLAGFQVMAFTDHGDEVGRFAELVRTQAVDGFVLTDTTVDDPRARYLAEAGAPFAAMGRLAPDLPQSWVDIDNAAAMRQALDHLDSVGRRDIALVLPDADGYWWDERVAGYQQWTADRGGSPSGVRILRAPLGELQGEVHQLLASAARPDALLAAGDAAVVPCYRAASRLGLQIGIDLAIVGFDPQLWMLDPPLTTLTVPLETVAALLVERLLRQVNDGVDGDPGIVVDTQLVLRESG